MNIDISPIDHMDIDVSEYIDFVTKELKRHFALVKNKEYKKIAFTPTNQNNFKNFFEEMVPLMFFLGTRKNNYQKIKYMAGSQKGDALLDSKTIIEITKAQNKQYYLLTQDMLNHGHAFSPKNIQKTVTTRFTTKTRPYVHRNKEHVTDVAQYIYKSIDKKQKKDYPCNSILLILFDSDTPLLENDGDYVHLEQEIENYEKGIFSTIYIVENFIKDDLRPKWQFIL